MILSNAYNSQCVYIQKLAFKASFRVKVKCFHVTVKTKLGSP